MRSLLFPALLAVVTGLLASTPRAASQPGDDFGKLELGPPAAPPVRLITRPTLPRGMEPVGHTTRAAPVPAAPNPFPLSADAGAWMVCAAAYSGPDGAELARQVCVILREQHHLAAYIFNRGAEERRKQDEEWERIKKANPNVPMRRRRVRYEDHYAVLVGGWADFKTASEQLSRIKALPIPKLELDGGKSPYEMMTYQDRDPKTKKVVIKRAPLSPYHNAMVTRNPLAPNQGPSKPKWDPYWVKLNAGEEFSLLKSKSQISLLVKEYTGGQILQSRQTSGSLLGSLFGPKQGEALAAAAAQAHELARFLTRQNLGHKVFVLHTRNASIVTVGEFSGPNDANLPRTMKLLSSLSFKDKNTGIDPIGLLPNPVPIIVPRPDR